MPEKQSIFNIEKQEAGRDILNIAIQHLATGKKANLSSIQYSLRKGETTKGNFFKKEPEWVDYEQGYIVERKDATEIIKNLEHNKVQLVLGKPASGKSLILKNVGFKLANENKKIYIVELKKHQIEDVKLYFEAIPEINDNNPIFIVDDAHLYHSECEKLIRDFKSGGKGKLIIGSRPTEDILPTHPKKTSEFQFLNKTEIQAENVTEEMIRTFLKIKHGFNDDRIKTVSGNLEKYKNDLWQLSWALNSYKPEKDSVDEEEIYENIMISITEIETKDRKTISGEDVFLPLSIFYRYEIPIERKFLEKQLGIKKETIEQLIELSEIIETEEKSKPIMLALNHSSIAELYIGAYQNYPSFGEEIREKILNEKDKKLLVYCSFIKYLKTTDENQYLDVMDYLGRDWNDKKGGLTLIKNLVENEKIYQSIQKGIDEKFDVYRIGRCIFNIVTANELVALKLVNSINVSSLSSKIDNEQDIGKVASCISNFTWKHLQELLTIMYSVLGKIDIRSLSLKIDKEEDIEKVGACVSSIGEANNEVGLKLVNNIDMHALSLKIDKEEDIEKIGRCLLSIRNGNNEVALKLVNNIDMHALSLKIDKEEDIEKIGTCVSSIGDAGKVLKFEIVDGKFTLVHSWVTGITEENKEVILNLLNIIDIHALSLKINRQEDIGKVGSCISSIAFESKEVALKLANIINIQTLSLKIDNEKDITKIGGCIRDIASASEEVALKLLEHIDIKLLSSKINKEEDIEKIRLCVTHADGSKEVALKLVDRIDIHALSLKIDNEKDITNIWSCIKNIAEVNKEAALKLVNNINITTIYSKIDKEEDIERIGWCVSVIADVNKEVALKLVDIVLEKIKKEEDIEKISSCVSQIAEASEEVAQKLADSVSARINKEEDIEKVWSCVSIIKWKSKEVANEIVNRLNPKLSEELQKRMSKL